MAGRPTPPPSLPADRLLERTSLGLWRWFGPYGALALLTRAISRARGDHPVLGHLALVTASAPIVTGTLEGTTAHGPQATIGGIIALLTTLLEMLRRLIGADLAVGVLEHSTAMAEPVPTAPDTSQKSNEP